MTNFPEEIRAHAAQEVTRFGRDLGIDLALDETGNCYFEHRNGLRMAILLTGDSQIVTAVALLSDVELKEEQVGEILTDFNWLGTRIKGATLSWNPRSRNFLLWYSRDANVIRTDDLGQLLTRLLSVADALRPELEARITNSDTTASNVPVTQNAPVNWIAQRA
jgi:hypothetical protein